MASSYARQRKQQMASPQPPQPPGRAASTESCCLSSSAAAAAPSSSSFRLLSSLPVELLEDVVASYLGSSFALTTLTSLSSSFHSLLTSASLCRRLLLLLQAALPCPSLPAALLTEPSLWPGVASHYALLRCLHRYSRLLGHWRSVQSHLGRLLCFSLHPQEMRIVGVDVSVDVAAAAAGGRAGAGASLSQRAVVEIELLADAAPRLFYLEHRTAAAALRHPAALRFLQPDERTAKGGKGGDGTEAAATRLDAFSVSTSASRGFPLPPALSSFPTRSRQAAAAASSSSSSPSDPFTPPAALWPSEPFSSFSLYCPSLPNSSHLTLALQTLPTPMQRQQQAVFFPNPPSTYHRLPAAACCSSHDEPGAPHGRCGSPPSLFPPRGLYVGQYGPHGAELMAVEHVGDELLAVKVLGDANVPAGKVSFRIHMPPALSAATGETRGAAEGRRRRSRAQAAGSRPQLSLSALHESTISESLESPPSPLSSSSRWSEDEMQDAQDGDDSEEDALDDAAAVGSGADDADSSADTSEMDVEAAESLAAAFLLHRRHLPRSQPTLPALAALSGSGTIALPGFNSAQAVDVRCFFHFDHSFTLDFLGLIAFTPFTCPLHHDRSAAAAASPRCHHSSGEEAEAQQLQEVQAGSESRRGGVHWLPRLRASRCPRHLYPV